MLKCSVLGAECLVLKCYVLTCAVRVGRAGVLDRSLPDRRTAHGTQALKHLARRTLALSTQHQALSTLRGVIRLGFPGVPFKSLCNKHLRRAAQEAAGDGSSI